MSYYDAKYKPKLHIPACSNTKEIMKALGYKKKKMLSIHTEAMENSNTPIQLFAHKMYVYVLQYVCMHVM